MGDFFRGLPLYWAKVIAALLYLLLGLWVITRPRDFIFRGTEDKSRWRDLRLWALVLIGIQIILYFLF